MAPAELTDLKFVGPATKAVLERAGVGPKDIDNRRITHAELIRSGVNPGVAARIRREHSLSWTLEGGEDLDRRAEQVRGLQDEERAWVAASSKGWESGDEVVSSSSDSRDAAEEAEIEWRSQEWPMEDEDEPDDLAAEAAWRERSRPEPVTEIDGIGERFATRLSEAGINSVRSLATCDPDRVATSLDLPEQRVRKWREAARAHE